MRNAPNTNNPTDPKHPSRPSHTQLKNLYIRPKGVQIHHIFPKDSDRHAVEQLMKLKNISFPTLCRVAIRQYQRLESQHSPSHSDPRPSKPAQPAQPLHDPNDDGA